jgi:hypothetical protein
MISYVHPRKHCAPLERGSWSMIQFYKHLAPLEPERRLVARG